ncbi:hypothetical protein KIPB_005179 [Kipferlia bialata]|uniref:Uncharacterized protein n=1 Tax=Kipferlia bialata TaxID=797122 RepID=A0A391NR96_9EUKA|nr:hypothetical protein KIPB_005179 [Kipferlia bialata]|eukprot:g5179.t1
MGGEFYLQVLSEAQLRAIPSQDWHAALAKVVSLARQQHKATMASGDKSNHLAQLSFSLGGLSALVMYQNHRDTWRQPPVEVCLPPVLYAETDTESGIKGRVYGRQYVEAKRIAAVAFKTLCDAFPGVFCVVCCGGMEGCDQGPEGHNDWKYSGPVESGEGGYRSSYVPGTHSVSDPDAPYAFESDHRTNASLIESRYVLSSIPLCGSPYSQDLGLSVCDASTHQAIPQTIPAFKAKGVVRKGQTSGRGKYTAKRL